MRRLIYNGILAIGLILAGCTSFEQYASEVYDAGPSIAVTATAVTDSTFTLTVTPGTGTVYYSYVVEQADAPKDVVAASLLKGVTYKGILSGVINTTDYPTFTSNLRNKAGAPLCLPNKVYQIYAVAANKEGIVGEVTKITVTTTDSKSPGAASFSGNASTKSAAVTFSENIVRSTGKVTATYYKEYDVANPTVVELTNSNITISGKVVTISAPDAPAGAFVNFNWEAGAFKDVFGNPCSAYTTKGFSATTGAQVGVRFRAETVAFDVLDKYFTTPAVGSTFLDWSTFEGTLTFDANIYRVNSKVKTGDLSVVYSTATRTTTVQLASSNWSITGASIKFKLPEAPAFGDGVSLNIKAGVFFDVYGNPNAAYTSSDSKWTLFKFTKQMVLGDFNFSGVSTYDNILYDMGNFKMEENTSEANTLKIKDFVLPNSVLTGTYNLDTRKLYMVAFDSIGLWTSSGGTTYEMYLYNYVNSSAETIVFDINADGTITGNELALVVYNPLTDKLSFYDKFKPATFTPKAAAKVMGTHRIKAIGKKSDVNLIPITDRKIINAFHKLK